MVATTTDTPPTLIPNIDRISIAPPPPAAPTPLAMPVPIVHRTVPVRAVAPVPRLAGPLPAPVVRRNWLTSGDGTLDTAVGVYTDCSGSTALSRRSAAIDTCIPGPPYFVGHNAGVFTPLMHMGVGSTITYHDQNAVAHVWRVVSVRADWRAADGAAPPTQADVVAQFQTCVVPDGSIDRILDVVPA